ncbi:Peptidase A1 domain-containing protein [Mycena kentingensis (nom. inval.)]|nr:Peptidase A1 domain-containing protein [Mycena kentingensis (nom. inval.)]
MLFAPLLLVLSPAVAQQADFSLPISRVPISRVPGRTPRLGQAAGPDGINVFNSQQYTYNVKCGFGEPPQYLDLVLDTGSSDCWVCSDSCQDADCRAVPCFKPPASNSLIDTRDPFNLEYLSGQVHGTICYDSLWLGSFKILNQAFAVALKTAELGLASSMTSGIIGLGFPASAAIPPPAGGTILDNIMAARPPNERFFAFHLPRESGLSDPTASFTVGRLDPQIVNDSSLIQTMDVVPTGTHYDYWKISMKRLTCNGVPFSISSSRILHAPSPIAVLDSGTTLILGPSADVAAFYDQCGGGRARYTREAGYQLPCKLALKVCFVLGNAEYCLDPADVSWDEAADGDYCLGGLQANDRVNAADWLLGDTFLRNVYVVHYYSAQPQIGLLGLTDFDAALEAFRHQRGSDLDDGGGRRDG